MQLIMQPKRTSLEGEIMIDGIPAREVAQKMIASGMAKMPGHKTEAEREAYKERRRKKVRECMQRLRARLKEEERQEQEMLGSEQSRN